MNEQNINHPIALHLIGDNEYTDLDPIERALDASSIALDQGPCRNAENGLNDAIADAQRAALTRWARNHDAVALRRALLAIFQLLEEV